MEDKFRQSIVELKEGYQSEAKNKTKGTGILPINHESELKARELGRVLSLYDKHFRKENIQ